MPERAPPSPRRRRTSGRARRTNLVDTVVERLRASIGSGALAPGDKLPSEAGLTQEHRVSRTVIREAVATLRADGLVEVRHGVGVFVTRARPSPLDAFQPSASSSLSAVIEMLELRAAVEIEAAGLAAMRRSPAQEEAIWASSDAFEAMIGGGRPSAEADLAFHLAVADAANNPRFRDFLTMMGRNVIPRAMLRRDAGADDPPDYLRHIQAEHHRIASAISAQDEAAAREAVRVHLKGSQERYRDMMRRG